MTPRPEFITDEPRVEAGTRLLAEIREQPQALTRLLEHEHEIARVAGIIRQRHPQVVRFVGHGSSDNAASYGVYAFGLLPHLTALRDSITLSVYYGAELDMNGSTVAALSQSGQTPDVVEYVRRAREHGAFTIAVTNDETSDLAHVAEAIIPLCAGPERSVAATKTYVNEVAALGLLAAHIAGAGRTFADNLRATIDQLDATITVLEKPAHGLAQTFAFTGRMFVVGRGLEYGTAREIALKLLETCRIAAEPLTATDLAHGPVAAVDSLFPVWVIASYDEALPAVLDAAARARDAGATLVACGSAAGEVADAAHALRVPTAASPLLGPILTVAPGQLFAWALARAKGLDPDQPRGLSKITLAP